MLLSSVIRQYFIALKFVAKMKRSSDSDGIQPELKRRILSESHSQGQGHDRSNNSIPNNQTDTLNTHSKGAANGSSNVPVFSHPTHNGQVPTPSNGHVPAVHKMNASASAASLPNGGMTSPSLWKSVMKLVKSGHLSESAATSPELRRSKLSSSMDNMAVDLGPSILENVPANLRGVVIAPSVEGRMIDISKQSAPATAAAVAKSTS